MKTHNVNGKVVLIAGGAKNLGGLLSRNLARKGAKLVIHYNSESTKSDAEKTMADVQTLGVEAILVQADLTKVEKITELFDAGIEKLGGIDIAIHTVRESPEKAFCGDYRIGICQHERN